MSEGHWLLLHQLSAHKTTSPNDIDDISLSPYTCPPLVDCDFNTDLCGWTRSHDEEYIWDHGFGRVADSSVFHGSIKLAPADRTAPLQGMYIFSDFTQLDGDNGGEVSMVMLSEFVQGKKDACFTFYFMPVVVTSSTSFRVSLVDMNGM